MFRKTLVALAALGTVALLGGVASAQVVVHNPVVTAATVTYAPVVTTYSPVVTAAPTVVFTPPVVMYSRVVTSYAPVVTTYTPVVAARRVLIRPKVYVAGQPVRNFFRAITP